MSKRIDAKWQRQRRLLDEQASMRRRRYLQTLQFDGPYLVEQDGKRLLNFGSNDYLGLVTNPPQGFSQANGALSGSTASSLVCGWTDEHERLAGAIAKLEQTDSAVVLPTGFAACYGTVSTLAQPNDLILSDALNHASLIDGCRASRAKRLIYSHADVGAVAELLARYRSGSDQVWIVTDSVFSMDGDLAPLRALVELADQYDATLVVDEAHGTGVLGPQGGGLCEALNLQDQIAIRIGTLSKAIGHQGGFVAGPEIIMDTLIQFCRPLIYSTGLSPMLARGAAQVISQLPGLEPRRRHLAQLARRLRELLGVPAVGLAGEIPIVPVIVGSDARAWEASQKLRQQGFFVPAIRPPTVPDGTARLRISLSAAHDEAQIDRLAGALEKVLVEPGNETRP